MSKQLLTSSLKEINAKLEASGSSYFYKHGSRNGYNAVDLYTSNAESTRGTCVRCLDCNETYKVLEGRLQDDYEDYLGKQHKL